MADVSRGPVSTLPNALSTPPAGTMCDDHEDRPAVNRVQGETDSFGCEWNDMCAECYAKHRAYLATEDRSGTCDWCKKHAERLWTRRDYDEGMSGPVYEVCMPCINKQNDDARKELEEMDKGGDFYDYDD